MSGTATEQERVIARRDRLRFEWCANNKDIIQALGKFENEKIHVVYYWEMGLGGNADREDGKRWGFDISKEERVAFPWLKGRRSLWLYESDDGFVRESR